MANFNSQKRKNNMGVKKTNSFEETPEQDFQRMRLPREKDLEQFAIITQLMGSNQVKVLCNDGLERQVRIPGKLQKKVWLRENDIIIIKLWDFQLEKGDVVWRYLGNQVSWLKRKNFLKKFPI
jgi:translation initiation factor 1A